MLPRAVRMRSGDDFTQTVRRGVRVGTATLVLHGWRAPEDHSKAEDRGKAENSGSPETIGDGPLVGFVVSKAVGTAVTRNRVKRRLRHLVRERLDQAPDDAHVVVRALPAAATRPDRLPNDLDFAWRKLLSRWGATRPRVDSPWQPGCRDGSDPARVGDPECPDRPGGEAA